MAITPLENEQFLIMHIHPINRGDEMLLRAVQAKILAESPSAELVHTALDVRSVTGLIALQQPLWQLMRADGRLRRFNFTIFAKVFTKISLLYLDALEAVPKSIRPKLLPKSWRRIHRAASRSRSRYLVAGGYLVAEGTSEWYWRAVFI
jgi:hypothetical protein